FIAQVMTGDNALRRADDSDTNALSYAEVKAIASGNPAVLTLAESDAELQRLSVLKKSHADDQYLTRRRLRDLPQSIAELSQRLSGLTADAAAVQAHDAGVITISGQRCPRQEALDLLAQALDALPAKVSEPRRFPLGQYRGLRFGLTLHPNWS